MTLNYKLILPLLDTGLNKEDFTKDNGFIGIYNIYMEKPFLTNHIFILWEYPTNSDMIKRDVKIKKSPMLYDWDVIMIKHKPYVLYTFTIVGPGIKKIIKSSNLDRNDKFKIYKYWDYKDKDVNNFAITQKYTSTFEDLKVPEEDWKPDIEDIFKIKG